VSAAKLTIALDLRHPFSYLALAPAIRLADEIRTGVDWLPIDTPPLNPPSAPGPNDDRGIRHRRYRAQSLLREIEVYSRAQGLVIENPYRGDDTTAARIAWLWLRQRAPEALPQFLQQLFRGYWQGSIDPGDPARLSELLDPFVPASGFASWASEAGANEFASSEYTLRELGLFQAPAFVVDGEVFHGRQHLPMIRWILEGRRGAGPI